MIVLTTIVLLILLLITITTIITTATATNTDSNTSSTITINGEELVIRILEESKSSPHQRVCVRKNDDVDISFIGYYKDNGNGNVVEIDRNSNFRFHVGSKSVIEGLDVGIIGACINEKRQIVIPPSMGYSRHEKIPKGSTLLFNVYCNDINGIKKSEVVKPIDDFFASLDTNKDMRIDIDEFVKGLSSVDSIDDHIVMLHFQKADTNTDGTITHVEFKKATNLIKLANEIYAAKNSNIKRDL